MKSIILLAMLGIGAIVAWADKPFLATLKERVMYGHDAERNQFPHQVSLQYNDFGSWSHLCGGSILNEKWVVTSAYCIIFSPSFSRIVAGILNLSDNNGQIVGITSTIIHPDYKGGVNPNDIALIELKERLRFNNAVKPIGLPKAGSIPSGHATLSGWGSISTTIVPIMPDRLQTAVVEIIDYKSCANTLIVIQGNSNPLDEISNICTEPLGEGVKSIGNCYLDNGGPLIQGDTLIGIISWGITPCGQVGTATVFTKVSTFLNFINKYIN